MVDTFTQPGPRVSLFIGFKNDRPKPNLPKRMGIYPVQCSVWVCQSTATCLPSFSGRGNARIKLLFSRHIADKFRRPTILQLNIEGLTASKMNVLHHLAMQSEALVILLQETHCTDAEKLVLPNYQLAGSFLSRKHDLATFVHERLRYTLLDQSPRHRRSSSCVWTLMAIK